MWRVINSLLISYESHKLLINCICRADTESVCLKNPLGCDEIDKFLAPPPAAEGLGTGERKGGFSAEKEHRPHSWTPRNAKPRVTGGRLPPARQDPSTLWSKISAWQARRPSEVRRGKSRVLCRTIVTWIVHFRIYKMAGLPQGGSLRLFYNGQNTLNIQY